MQNKKMMWVSVLIVLVVVAGFVYITINSKNRNTMLTENNNNIAKIGDMVSINYTGKLEDGTVFDSNVDSKFNHMTPLEFTLGQGQVIPGFEKGVIGMKVGDKKTLVIPPQDAYGEKGAGDIIPPNATLVFDVELVNIKNVKVNQE